ncbi:hypothetical protein MMC26_007462 [Xylographa opegraphella]|nr:hypothetical protein [Xylographa opegraphella]
MGRKEWKSDVKEATANGEIHFGGMTDDSHSAVDALERYKATVLQGFQQETQKLEAALRDVLVPPGTLSSQDHVALRIELDALRPYPEKVRKLEQENAELRAKLGRAAKRADQSSAKSRSATPSTTIPKKHEPKIRNVVDSPILLGEPALAISASEAAVHWLYVHVEEDSDSRVAEVMLWNAYTSHSSSLDSAQAPLLSDKDLTSLAVRVFAGARVLDVNVNSSAGGRCIEGVKFRHTNMEFQRLERLIEKKDRDYAILIEKHFKLLGKSNELRESVKSWQAYYDRIVSMPDLKRHTIDDAASIGIDDEQSGGNTSWLVNTGNFQHRDTRRTPENHKAGSSNSTPRTDFPSQVHTGYPVRPVEVTASSDLDAELLFPQMNTRLTADHPRASNACASDDSTQLASSPTSDNKTASIGIVPAVAVVAGDDSDSPIVISERSLKRKRQRGVEHGIFRVHEDTCRQVDTSRKRIFVKSELEPSPVAPINTHISESIHDTLDLDEVGDGGRTPVKRKGPKTLFGSKEVDNDTRNRPSSLRRTGYIENGHTDLIASTDDLNLIQYQEDDKNVGASCRTLGDAYGQRLLQEHFERKAESVKDRETVDYHTPQHSRVAKQHHHSQNVNLRQDQWMSESHNATTGFEGGAAISAEDQVSVIFCAETKKGLQPLTSNILQPLTPNTQILPRTSMQACVPKVSPARKRCSNSSAQISMLSEDGDCDSRYGLGVKTDAKQHTDSVSRSSSKVPTITAIHQRLGGLLSEPSPEKPTLARSDRITRPGRILEDLKSFHESFTTRATRSGGTGNVPRETAFPTQTSGVEAEQARETVHPSNTGPVNFVRTAHGSMRERRPLRSRSVRSLRLDDFKLNPAVNQGVDFAFNQVIRSKDQRKCLPNCTKAECCGDKFHKMVRIGGMPAPQSRGLWDSSPTDDAEHDYGLLRDSTGLDVEGLERMSTAEKDSLLEQAKARKFGSEYGRHRYAHERAASPPGFWRTEMPTTQEVEGDKEKAQAVERAKIEARYKEAMKGSGKWIFRDE